MSEILDKVNLPEDVKELIEFIKDAVKERYGVELKVEQEFVNWE